MVPRPTHCFGPGLAVVLSIQGRSILFLSILAKEAESCLGLPKRFRLSKTSMIFLNTDRSTIDKIHAVEPNWLPWIDLVWGRSVAASSEHPPPSFRPSRIPDKCWYVLISKFKDSGMGHWTVSGLDKDTWRCYHVRAARPLAGLSTMDPYARKEPGLRAWRNTVITRDGHKCTACSATEFLEAHHIPPYSADEVRRTDISNGRTLCHTCHRKLLSHRFYDGRG